MDYFIYCLKNYALFSGRARRKEFWMFALFQFLTLFVAGILDYLIGTSFISAIAGLALLVPSLAVAARRLHDIGKGAGWLFIALIPAVGQIWLFVLLVLDSEPGENRFGANPKN